MSDKHNHGDSGFFGRRGFICRCCAGVASASMLAAINRPALANTVTFKATHGTGLCNLAIFLAHKRGTAEQFGVHLEFVSTPASADIAAVFGSGQVDISSVPYTNYFTIADKGAPVKIIAGTGVEGCIVVARPGIDSADQLRGKSIATFQADTLEVLPYDLLKAHGVSWDEVDMRFMGSSPEIVQAFVSGAVDAMSHIEPYASQGLAEVPGSKVISDGTDVYGNYYTDCVIAASDRVIGEYRDELKGLIHALMISQLESEQDRVQAMKDTVGTYYKTDLDTLLDASTKQFLKIDQRKQQQFMVDRSISMVELGYIKKPIDDSTFDWSLLEEVIAENPELYRALIVA